MDIEVKVREYVSALIFCAWYTAMTVFSRSFIAGTGSYLPHRVVSNSYLAGLMDTSDAWIRERTGICERRFAEPGQGPSDLAVEASRAALADAGITEREVDFIIFATATPDYYLPGSGCLLQRKMGFENIGALDIRAQCSGFIYGLSVADQFIRTGHYKTILLVGAEVQSTGLDLSTAGRDTAVIFADGAGAVIMRGTDETRGVFSTHLHSDGRFAEELMVEAPSSFQNPRLSAQILESRKQYVRMNGREVFKHAVERFSEVINEALESNNVDLEKISLIIPHQANLRISKMIAKRLGIPENKVFSNIEKYGNTTAASIPIALDEALKEERISPGDLIVFAAFGSGFTWASALIRW